MDPVDINLPSTWVRYRSGLCRDCSGGCCTLPVEVDANDLVRLGLAGEDEIQGSLKKLAKRLERDGDIIYFRAASGLFTLAQLPNGDCRYLDGQRRCTVYDRRPEVCRKFPTELGPRLSFCPYKKKKVSAPSPSSRGPLRP